MLSFLPGKYTKVSGRVGWALRFALVLVVAACGPKWTPVTPTPMPYTPERNKRVQIWTHDDGIRYWYAVVITRDSVTGIPYNTSGDLGRGKPRPIHGDTVRSSLPVSEVDSIRLGSYNSANTYVLAGVLTWITVYTVVSKCHDPLGCT